MNSANIKISVGMGIIGTQLSKKLLEIRIKSIDKEAIEKADWIAHLAGANLTEGRWNKKRKQLIIESRIKREWKIRVAKIKTAMLLAPQGGGLERMAGPVKKGFGAGQSFSAAIFDMDGVLADNMDYHTRAWELFLKKHAPHLKIDDVKPHYGKTNADLMSFIFGRPLTADEVERYGEEKESLYRQLYATEMAPLPGLLDFLEELRAKKWQAVVATSAPRSNVDFLLDGLHIRRFFDAVIDASQVIRGKPDPEIYLRASRAAGCKPENCIVFEDALSGIEAGRRAGMRVVGVATTLPAVSLTGTALVIKDFREVNVAKLEKLLLRRHF